MIRYWLLLIVAMAVCCFGCGNETSKCSDPQITERVLSLAKEEVKSFLHPSMLDSSKLELKNIRNKPAGDKNVNCRCLAELSVQPEGWGEPPILYSISYNAKVLNDKNELNVVVREPE